MFSNGVLQGIHAGPCLTQNEFNGIFVKFFFISFSRSALSGISFNLTSLLLIFLVSNCVLWHVFVNECVSLQLNMFLCFFFVSFYSAFFVLLFFYFLSLFLTCMLPNERKK